MKITNSEFSWYFDEIPSENLDEIIFLDKEEANKVWLDKMKVNVKSLYKLPVGSWIDKANWLYVGSWLNAFNSKENPLIMGKMIREYSDWQDKERLYLIADKSNIISLMFRDFEKYWVNLFYIFDDGPLLLTVSPTNTAAFRFTPSGDLLYGRLCYALTGHDRTMGKK